MQNCSNKLTNTESQNMEGYPFKEIAEVVNGKYIGNSNPRIRNILTDSRTTLTSIDSVFIAIKGKNHDGHEHIPELYEKGVRNFVVSSIPALADTIHDANFLLVDDPLHSLQKLAEWHRGKFNIPVIGITGSNGKTVVKEWLYQIMAHFQNVLRSPKSFNSQLGVPLSVWLLDENADLAIFEAGISQKGEMEKLSPIICPQIGIITNIGEAHQENFSSTEEKTREKLLLFKKANAIIYCKDYNDIKKVLTEDSSYSNIKHINWSISDKTSFLYISKIESIDGKSTIYSLFQGNKYFITIPFIDRASIENAISCWVTLLYLGFTNHQVQKYFKELMPVAMRLELKNGINNCTIINDSYNSDLVSLSLAIDFLMQQHQHLKKTVILSDIFQSGKLPEKLYLEVADILNSKGVTRLIGIGRDINASRKAFSNLETSFYKSTEDFIDNYTDSLFQNEALLIKGSRSFRFEKISGILEEKVHRTVLEINLTALTHNLNFFRSKTHPNTKLMVMVKALSYGSGSYEIANMLQYQKIDYLAVAYADEGVSLRQAGISLPIMVMSPEPGSFDAIIEYRLEPEIYSTRLLNSFTKKLEHSNLTSYPVHIKLDTGMHRLGFEHEELNTLINLVKTNNQLKIKSVFTHLAASDDPQQDDFTYKQIELFKKMSTAFTSQFDYKILRHVLNSSGIERFHEHQFDMVRLGLGLYGISKINQPKLLNISTFKTTITQIKSIKKGNSIGYGRMAKAQKNMKIAIVPVGYADGLNRKLGNGIGKLIVNGKFASITGSICMDMCMIDITGITANEGDEAIIFGEGIPVTRIADWLNTIPYEILTSISSRVKRIYFQE